MDIQTLIIAIVAVCILLCAFIGCFECFSRLSKYQLNKNKVDNQIREEKDSSFKVPRVTPLSSFDIEICESPQYPNQRIETSSTFDSPKNPASTTSSSFEYQPQPQHEESKEIRDEKDGINSSLNIKVFDVKNEITKVEEHPQQLIAKPEQQQNELIEEKKENFGNSKVWTDLRAMEERHELDEDNQLQEILNGHEDVLRRLRKSCFEIDPLKYRDDKTYRAGVEVVKQAAEKFGFKKVQELISKNETNHFNSFGNLKRNSFSNKNDEHGIKFDLKIGELVGIVGGSDTSNEKDKQIVKENGFEEQKGRDVYNFENHSEKNEKESLLNRTDTVVDIIRPLDAFAGMLASGPPFVLSWSKRGHAVFPRPCRLAVLTCLHIATRQANETLKRNHLLLINSFKQKNIQSSSQEIPEDKSSPSIVVVGLPHQLWFRVWTYLGFNFDCENDICRTLVVGSGVSGGSNNSTGGNVSDQEASQHDDKPKLLQMNHSSSSSPSDDLLMSRKTIGSSVNIVAGGQGTTQGTGGGVGVNSTLELVFEVEEDMLNESQHDTDIVEAVLIHKKQATTEEDQNEEITGGNEVAKVKDLYQVHTPIKKNKHTKHAKESDLGSSDGDVFESYVVAKKRSGLKKMMSPPSTPPPPQLSQLPPPPSSPSISTEMRNEIKAVVSKFSSHSSLPMLSSSSNTPPTSNSKNNSNRNNVNKTENDRTNKKQKESVGEPSAAEVLLSFLKKAAAAAQNNELQLIKVEDSEEDEDEDVEDDDGQDNYATNLNNTKSLTPNVDNGTRKEDKPLQNQSSNHSHAKQNSHTISPVSPRANMESEQIIDHDSISDEDRWTALATEWAGFAKRCLCASDPPSRNLGAQLLTSLHDVTVHHRMKAPVRVLTIGRGDDHRLSWLKMWQCPKCTLNNRLLEDFECHVCGLAQPEGLAHRVALRELLSSWSRHQRSSSMMSHPSSSSLVHKANSIRSRAVSVSTYVSTVPSTVGSGTNDDNTSLVKSNQSTNAISAPPMNVFGVSSGGSNLNPTNSMSWQSSWLGARAFFPEHALTSTSLSTTSPEQKPVRGILPSVNPIIASNAAHPAPNHQASNPIAIIQQKGKPRQAFL